MRGHCCAWAGLWSMSGAARSARCRVESRWYRRHLRRSARRPAVAPVQRPLRRIRLSADCRLRWRGPLRHRRPAPGEAAEGRRDPGVSAPPHPRDPGPLAAGGNPRSCRQPLCLPGGPRLVRGEQPRLHPRPRPHQHAPARAVCPCRARSPQPPAPLYLPIPHPAAAETNPLANNHRYLYSHFNTKIMLFPDA